MSQSQSPVRLTPMDVTIGTMPGNVEIHHDAHDHLASHGYGLATRFGLDEPASDSIEHGSYFAEEPELLAQMAARGVTLVVVDGNPLDDVNVLLEPERIELVVKGGTICVDRRPK